jgi:hypothetical protein
VLFKQANVFGMFYGIATFITVIGTFLIASHLIREDGSWMAVTSLALTVIASIIGVRIVLATPD